jgi:hypothetical protein
MADTHQVGVEPECLRALVRDKYRVFATDPGAAEHGVLVEMPLRQSSPTVPPPLLVAPDAGL